MAIPVPPPNRIKTFQATHPDKPGEIVTCDDDCWPEWSLNGWVKKADAKAETSPPPKK